MFGCNHQWGNRKFTFNPPIRNVRSFRGFTTAEIQRFLNGYTNITIECLKCGKLDHYTVTGRVNE